jgi:geranylgeranyl reductase family protein
MDQVYDVVVVGAGPGGSAAAYYLSAHGLKVLLLDKSDFPREKTCGDGLTPHALRILDEMEILAEVARIGNRINGIAIHSPGGYTVKTAVPRVAGFPDHLLIVPRLKLDNLIRQQAVANGAQFLAPVNVRGVRRERDTVFVLGENRGRTLSFKARLVVLATGANLGLLARLGMLRYKPEMILAVRAYFDGLEGLSDEVQVYTEGIPMPGYGWVFPTSATSANLGVGVMNGHGRRQRRQRSAGNTFDVFLQSAALRKICEHAHQVGPRKGYPLRIDFPRSPTSGNNMLLVGEAAGLVSPLTGEGIDLALESGKMAAEHTIGMFARGDFSFQALAAYDRELRQRYGRLFSYLRKLRRMYLNPILTDRVIRLADKASDLNRLLVSILLGYQDAALGLTPRILWRVLKQ